MKASAAALAIAGLGALAPAPAAAQGGGLRKLEGVRKSPLSTAETPNTYDHVTSFNNFYEFALGRRRRSQEAGGPVQAEPVDVWPSKDTWRSRRRTRSKTSSSRTCSKSASIASAASRPGRW